MSYVANVAKMLIVDDEPRMTDSAKAVLHGLGVEIETSNCSTEALSRLQTADYDVAILDIRMPGLTGYQLLDALDREEVQTEFIIMTGEVSLDSAIEAVRRGASDYIRKPFEPDELIIRVRNAFKQKQLKDERQEIETEKQDLERQLRQSQKMEAIGTLAGGIAHDFNNILTIILGNTELACAIVPEGNEVQDNLEKIQTASKRAKEMVNHLLSFSRKTESERHPVELKAIVTESLKLLRASLPTNIVIRHDLPDTSFVIQGNATQIHQIMINLCTNAAHAVEGTDGVLGVRLENQMVDRATADRLALSPGPHVRLTVSDTGRGIDPSMRERIFDPYFTTKDPGKGTGMGLAVVHGIVINHGGAIEVFSEQNVKTEFRVLLPVADAEATLTNTSTKTALPTGLERILLVDDEELIVDVVKQMLVKLGYQVDASTDSRAALEMFRQDPQRYDLVVTDMTMPNLTGKQLAKEIKQVRSETRIILCSGYSEKIGQADPRELGVTEFALKPIGMQQLAQIIRNVLDRRPLERRKHQRFIADNGAFVIPKPAPSNRGKLLDISMSGLSFRCFDAEEGGGRVMDITISTADNVCSVDNLNCRTVSESKGECGPDPLAAPTRRSGIQFKKLTTSQENQLSYFIQNHTRQVSH